MQAGSQALPVPRRIASAHGRPVTDRASNRQRRGYHVQHGTVPPARTSPPSRSYRLDGWRHGAVSMPQRVPRCISTLRWMTGMERRRAARAMERNPSGAGVGYKALHAPRITQCDLEGRHPAAPHRIPRSRRAVEDRPGHPRGHDPAIHRRLSRHRAPVRLPLQPREERLGMREAQRVRAPAPRGAAPLCYDADVTPGMILEWRRSHQGRS